MSYFCSRILKIAFIVFAIVCAFPHASPVSDNNEANAFVTFRINDKDILDNVRRIQAELAGKNPFFWYTFQPIQSLHVTLFVIRLDVANIQRAKSALRTAAQKYNGTREIVFVGLDHFAHDSLFAALEPESVVNVTSLHDFVRSKFIASGIRPVGEFKTFHPHMSLSLLNHINRWLAKFWPEIEASWKGNLIGTQYIHSLQICDIQLNEETQDYDVLYEVGF